MVTRAVENAQKKVESLHFESRKHLLQYDDVANAQRKVIYSFRQDLLNPEFSLKERIEENRVLFVDEVLSQCDIIDGFAKEEYNLLKLVEMVAEEGTVSVDQEYFTGLEASDIREKLLDILTTVYENKMSEVEVARREEIEKIVFLQILDEVWREHLYQMDILKTGIGLRGYNQKDPLVEYKKESFNLFSELIHEIKLRTTKMLLAIRFRQEEAQESIEHAKQMMQEGQSDSMPLSQKQKERKEKYAQKKQLDI
jgi:preprotein translocase subunit SecA